MCTIGYGDGYPSTHLGRAIMVMTAGMSLVAISLYIVALNTATMLGKEQSKAYYMIKNQRQRVEYKKNASNIIKSAFAIKKTLINKNKKNYIKDLFLSFALLRNYIHHPSGKNSSRSRYLPPSEMIMQLEHKLVEDINYLKKEIIDIDYIKERLFELIKTEETFMSSIDLVLNNQDTINSMISDLNLESFIKNTKMNSKIS